MINEIGFRQFKGLRSVDIELSRLTVIVGANASGKTSILEGVYNLCRAIWGKADQVMNPSYLSFAYRRGGQGELQIQGRGGGETCLLRAVPPSGYISQQPLSNPSGDGIWEVRLEILEKRPNWLEVNESHRKRLSPFQSSLLRFDASRLAAPSSSEFPRPSIAPNGEGLAPALAYVALNQPDQFREIQDRMRQIVPGLKRIRFDKMAASKLEHEIVVVDGVEVPRDVHRNQVQDLIMFDFENASDVPSLMVSEGTLIGLGLLTVLLGTLRPSIVLMDDLEHGLHPRAQRSVMRILRELMANDPELQIIATTHSPFIADEVGSNELLLVTSDPTDGTVCGRISEHPEFARWKDEMLPGEYWSMVGEDWLKNTASAE